MRKSSILQTVIAIVLGTTLFGSAVAQAQEAPSGLTVVGYGQASAPADTATIEFVVGDGYYGQPQPPEPGATPGAEEREAVAPVVASLTDAGVPEDDIEVIVAPYVSERYGFGGPAIALFRINLTNPDTQRITELIDAASVGAAEERLIVSGIAVSYGIEDCTALEREAKEQAIADARQQADVQAELLDVSVGELLASRDIPVESEPAFGPYGPSFPGGPCDPLGRSSAILGMFSVSPFDPTTEPMVTVYAQVELTFGMSAGAEATPAA